MRPQRGRKPATKNGNTERRQPVNQGRVPREFQGEFRHGVGRRGVNRRITFPLRRRAKKIRPEERSHRHLPPDAKLPLALGPKFTADVENIDRVYVCMEKVCV